MAKYPIYYLSYSSSERATEYSRFRSQGQFVLLMFLVVFGGTAIVFYMFGIKELIANMNIIYFLETLAAVVGASVFALYLSTIYPGLTDMRCEIMILKECAGSDKQMLKPYIQAIRKQAKDSMVDNMKPFIAGYCPIFTIGTGVIAAYHSIRMLLKQPYFSRYIVFLIISILLIAGGIAIYLVRYYRDKHSVPSPSDPHDVNNDKTYERNEPQPDVNNGTILFCRKCGVRIMPDSVFCSKCGSKI